MAKKFSMLLAAVAVIAFAVPSFANAETGLTETAGTFIPVGTKVEATNIGAVTTTSTKTGNIKCEEVTVTGEVAVDSAAEVKISPTSDGVEHNFAKKCSVPSGAEVKVTSIKITEISTKGEVKSGSVKKGKFVVSFVIDVGTATCTYTTSAGEGTYVAGSDVMSVAEAPLTVSPAAACGSSAKLDGEFTVRTDVSPFSSINIM
jgi:hypothetical protein